MAKIILNRYIELPTDIGEILWYFQQLELSKGVQHKYVRRIQNKTPPPKWRYFYDVGGGQGLGHHEEMKEGAKFKVEGGHYEIIGVDGDSVKIRHDETGEEKIISKEKLKDILHSHHKERIKQRSENIKRLVVSAKKFGTKKQQERLRAKEKKEKELFGKKKIKKIKEKEDGKAKTETKTTRRSGKRVLGNAGRRQKVAGQPHEKSVDPAPKGAPETTKTAAEIMNDPPTPITAEFSLPDGQKIDIKPPSENPAIDLHPDLWPQIDELPKLPDDVIRFPNPAPLTTSEGKITGHIEQLYPHQIEGAQRVLYAWQKGDGMVLGDSAGLGKTNIAMAALVANKGKRNLIVVPVAGKEGLKAQWIGDRAARLYNIDIKGAEVETTKRGREKVNFKSDELSSTEDGTYIVSYDELYETKLDENGDPVKDENGKTVKQLRKSLFDGKWDAVVFDESHTMQKQGGLFSTAGKDLADRADKALYLSATPYTNISDMHYLTKLGLFGNSYNEFKKWAELAGAKIDGNKIKNPSSHLPMAAIAATLHVHGKSVKRSTSLEGVMSQFDQSLRSNLTPEQSEAFKTADRIIDMASKAINPEFLKALYVGWNRQYWELCKVDKAIEFGKKAIDEGKQVAFFTSYKAANHAHLRAIPKMIRNRAEKLEVSTSISAQTEAKKLFPLADDIDEVIAQLPKGDSAVKRLVNAFGGSDKVAEIHGDTTKKPHSEQESYQTGSKKVCVATMARGGTGISLHDTTGERPRVQVNLSLPWSGREFNQVAGRSHRLGSKSDTTMYWMVGDDSHEMHNGAVVAKRLQSMGSLTAGDPELTVDANNLLAWEFANNGPNSDDEKDFQDAIEQMDQEVSGDLPKDKEDQIKNAAISEHAQAARDYFREYAERIKAGGDVIRERYEEAKTRAEKKEFRESRRAAEQLRQYLKWSVHWRPYDGMWEVDKSSLGGFESEVKKSSIAGKPKTYGGRYVLSYQIHPDSMKQLAKNLGVSERKVDLTVEEYADPSKRSEVEVVIDNLDKKKLRTRFWGYSRENEPIYLITGDTYPNRAALGAVGFWNKRSNGYMVPERYLNSILENLKRLGDYSRQMESSPIPYKMRPGVAKEGEYKRHTHLAKGRFIIRNPLRG